jgi:hypothetical protein
MRGFVMSESETAAKRSAATTPHPYDRTAVGPHASPADRAERKRVRGGNEFPPSEGLRPSRKRITPEQVLAAFNVRAFRREAPGDLQLMLQLISRAIAFNEAIPFVMYWGKGPRAAMAKPDLDCIAFLGAMIERIRETYPPGAKLKLIFTDTHALLNGHNPAHIRVYFDEIELCAHVHGFDTAWLGDIVRAAEGRTEAPTAEDMVMSEDMAMRLTASARKWYRGEETVEEGARRYFQANMVERSAVEIAFPHSIMITFNSSALRALLPRQLPVFYMYSIRRGFSVKPWFILPDAEH